MLEMLPVLQLLNLGSKLTVLKHHWFILITYVWSKILIFGPSLISFYFLFICFDLDNTLVNVNCF